MQPMSIKTRRRCPDCNEQMSRDEQGPFCEACPISDLVTYLQNGIGHRISAGFEMLIPLETTT